MGLSLSLSPSLLSLSLWWVNPFETLEPHEVIFFLKSSQNDADKSISVPVLS